ncbi:LuxR C-terminal-related transcriptional regulator [Seohaeicola nanhaiensis]|uniref:LuxR C-terminal-related transcriptional regulator n=1 Tax=Seohaeicola nanhaiensis TaxID=1387282 RepID=A0ABV9KAF7_9RHOB
MQPRPEIPEDTLSNWQRMVDLIARAAGVPASLVMRTHAPDHAVFLASQGQDNPYEVGQSFVLHEKLYCQGVFRRDGELVVEDARCDPDWSDNEDLEIDGMSFYIGYPLHWPDGAIFGTICVLDRRRNRKALLFREGLRQFARLIEADLTLLSEIARRKLLERDLQVALDEMEARVEERTEELQEANTALRVLLDRVESNRRRYDGEVLRQIKGMVLPHLGKLRARLADDPAGQAYLALAEENLTSVTSSMSNRLSDVFERLTPSEQEIAQLIMRGQTTKDIARTLSRELCTIEFHRNNIRKKLGLRKSGQNLRSMLNAIQ